MPKMQCVLFSEHWENMSGCFVLVLHLEAEVNVGMKQLSGC